MKKETYELFRSASMDEILKVIDTELQRRNESPFWTDKVVPFSRAILSVLTVLRDENRLFTPEGKDADELTPELFFAWSDFVSLKLLYFRAKDVDLDVLGEYLHRYNVNLENENLDFPISNYNLHQGVSNVIKSLL
ncbi:hypothetical protein [Sulfurimonas sp.]|uniref:hypothetical protein n=1 Tax=Sulfurimonas sp. TaxID=2022749 RepID=UPI0035678FBA